MTKVKCLERDCVNNEEYICSLDTISISFDGFFNSDNLTPCADCKSIDDTPEYQTPYFIRVKNPKTGRAEKRALKGKRIELLGMVFYTDGDTRYDENWWLTEEKTGYGMSKNKVMEHPEIVEKAIKEISPVSDLPTEGVSHE